MIDFSREFAGVDDRLGTLGQAVYEVVAAWPQGQLDVGQVVAFGGFANAVRAGGAHEIPPSVDRKLLVRMVCRAAPPVAVLLLEALGLVELALAME